eukprot:9497484-Pyramimonas_sp.AAC.1
MRTQPLGPSVELPVVQRNVWRGVHQCLQNRHARTTTGAFRGAPYEDTERVTSVPQLMPCRLVNATTGAFGGSVE